MLILQPWKLVTADIAYRMPDNRLVLQSFIWQDFDLTPELPVLRKFLRFWEANLDAPIHSVRFASKEIVAPASLRYRDHEVRLN